MAPEIPEYKGPTTETVIFCAGTAGGSENAIHKVIDSKNKVTVEMDQPISKLRILNGERPRAMLAATG
jgi:hypothetical protein